LNKFLPASGGDTYQSFQDFFTRVFKDPPKIISEAVWACEEDDELIEAKGLEIKSLVELLFVLKPVKSSLQ